MRVLRKYTPCIFNKVTGICEDLGIVQHSFGLALYISEFHSSRIHTWRELSRIMFIVPHYKYMRLVKELDNAGIKW